MDDSNLFLTEQLFLVGRNFTLYLVFSPGGECRYLLTSHGKEWTKKNHTKNRIRCVRDGGVNQLLYVS